MLALVPVILTPSELFWTAQEHFDLLRGFLRNVAETQAVERMFVLTNQPQVGLLCAELGYDWELLPRSGQRGADEAALGGFLPPGTSDCLALARRLGQQDGPSILIPGFRNPLLSPELLERAAKTHAESGRRCLVSVRQTVDHPCQCQSYYRVEQDLLCLFLESPLAPSEASDSAVTLCGCRSRLFDVDLRQIGGLYATPGLIWTGSQAQIEFPGAVLERVARNYPFAKGDRLAAVEHLPAGDAEPSMVVATSDGRLSLLLGRCAVWQGGGLLQGALLTAQGETEHFTLPFAAFSEPWREIELPLQAEGLPVALYATLLKPLEASGDYEFSMPSYFGGGLWGFNEKQCAVNLVTGQEVRGRQDFPELFEAERSLVVFAPGAAQDVEAALRDVALFEMGGSDSVHVETEVDILRFRAVEASRLLAEGTDELA